MPAILHIITQPEEPLSRELIRKQSAKQENTVEVFDLNQPSPDYKQLLEKVFAADSIEVW